MQKISGRTNECRTHTHTESEFQPVLWMFESLQEVVLKFDNICKVKQLPFKHLSSGNESQGDHDNNWQMCFSYL